MKVIVLANTNKKEELFSRLRRFYHDFFTSKHDTVKSIKAQNIWNRLKQNPSSLETLDFFLIVVSIIFPSSQQMLNNDLLSDFLNIIKNNGTLAVELGHFLFSNEERGEELSYDGETQLLLFADFKNNLPIIEKLVNELRSKTRGILLGLLKTNPNFAAHLLGECENFSSKLSSEIIKQLALWNYGAAHIIISQSLLAPKLANQLTQEDIVFLLSHQTENGLKTYFPDVFGYCVEFKVEDLKKVLKEVVEEQFVEDVLKVKDDRKTRLRFIYRSIFKEGIDDDLVKVIFQQDAVASILYKQEFSAVDCKPQDHFIKLVKLATNPVRVILENIKHDTFASVLKDYFLIIVSSLSSLISKNSEIQKSLDRLFSKESPLTDRKITFHQIFNDQFKFMLDQIIKNDLTNYLHIESILSHPYLRHKLQWDNEILQNLIQIEEFTLIFVEDPILWQKYHQYYLILRKEQTQSVKEAASEENSGAFLSEKLKLSGEKDINKYLAKSDDNGSTESIELDPVRAFVVAADEESWKKVTSKSLFNRFLGDNNNVLKRSSIFNIRLQYDKDKKLSFKKYFVEAILADFSNYIENPRFKEIMELWINLATGEQLYSLLNIANDLEKEISGKGVETKEEVSEEKINACRQKVNIIFELLSKDPLSMSKLCTYGEREIGALFHVLETAKEENIVLTFQHFIRVLQSSKDVLTRSPNSIFKSQKFVEWLKTSIKVIDPAVLNTVVSSNPNSLYNLLVAHAEVLDVVDLTNLLKIKEEQCRGVVVNKFQEKPQLLFDLLESNDQQVVAALRDISAELTQIIKGSGVVKNLSAKHILRLRASDETAFKHVFLNDPVELARLTFQPEFSGDICKIFRDDPVLALKFIDVVDIKELNKFFKETSLIKTILESDQIAKSLSSKGVVKLLKIDDPWISSYFCKNASLLYDVFRIEDENLLKELHGSSQLAAILSDNNVCSYLSTDKLKAEDILRLYRLNHEKVTEAVNKNFRLDIAHSKLDGIVSVLSSQNCDKSILEKSLYVVVSPLLSEKAFITGYLILNKPLLIKLLKIDHNAVKGPLMGAFDSCPKLSKLLLELVTDGNVEKAYVMNNPIVFNNVFNLAQKKEDAAEFSDESILFLISLNNEEINKKIFTNQFFTARLLINSFKFNEAHHHQLLQIMSSEKVGWYFVDSNFKHLLSELVGTVRRYSHDYAQYKDLLIKLFRQNECRENLFELLESDIFIKFLNEKDVDIVDILFSIEFKEKFASTFANLGVRLDEIKNAKFLDKILRDKSFSRVFEKEELITLISNISTLNCSEDQIQTLMQLTVVERYSDIGVDVLMKDRSSLINLIRENKYFARTFFQSMKVIESQLSHEDFYQLIVDQVPSYIQFLLKDKSEDLGDYLKNVYAFAPLHIQKRLVEFEPDLAKTDKSQDKVKSISSNHRDKEKKKYEEHQEFSKEQENFLNSFRKARKLEREKAAVEDIYKAYQKTQAVTCDKSSEFLREYDDYIQGKVIFYCFQLSKTEKDKVKEGLEDFIKYIKVTTSSLSDILPFELLKNENIYKTCLGLAQNGNKKIYEYVSSSIAILQVRAQVFDLRCALVSHHYQRNDIDSAMNLVLIMANDTPDLLEGYFLREENKNFLSSIYKDVLNTKLDNFIKEVELSKLKLIIAKVYLRSGSKEKSANLLNQFIQSSKSLQDLAVKSQIIRLDNLKSLNLDRITVHFLRNPEFAQNLGGKELLSLMNPSNQLSALCCLVHAHLFEKFQTQNDLVMIGKILEMGNDSQELFTHLSKSNLFKPALDYAKTLRKNTDEKERPLPKAESSEVKSIQDGSYNSISQRLNSDKSESQELPNLDRSQLLAQIHRGIPLKKVEKEEFKAEDPTDLVSIISKALDAKFKNNLNSFDDENEEEENSINLTKT